MPMEIEGQAQARCSVRKKKRAEPMPDKGWKRKGKGSKNKHKPDDKGLKIKGKGKGSKKKKAKLHDVDDEVKDEIMVADAAGSKDEQRAHPPATETVTMEMDLIEDYLMSEVVDYMTCGLLCPILHLKSLTGPFDPTLLDPFEKEANFAANILQQHRLTNGPIELQMEPITTDDDDDELSDSMGWMNWQTPEQRRKRRLEEKQEELEDEARWNKLKEEA